MQELKQFPILHVEVRSAAFKALERMREESKKNTMMLVDMEYSYLTVDFFRKLPQDVEKGGNPSHSIFDRYNDSYLRRIGKAYLHFCFTDCCIAIYCPTSHFTKQSSGQTVLSYVNMVCSTLRNSIPKSIVYCQVREAKRSLLDHFFTELGAREVRYFSSFERRIWSCYYSLS